MEIEKSRPGPFLEERKKRGAQDGTKDSSSAAEQAHDNHRNGRDQWKSPEGLDVGHVACIEAADDSWQRRRDEKGVELERRGRDSHRLGGDFVFSNCEQAQTKAG